MGRLTHYAHRAHEIFNERRLGIATAEIHEVLDSARPDFRGYGPTSYRAWNAIRTHIVASRHSSFIDYGAGLGRVTALAARLPFRRVIGIELDRDLAKRGNANLLRARGLIAQASIICVDATKFDVPPDASTFFFCNPFTGPTLAAVINRVNGTLIAHPRPAQFVCNLPEVSVFEQEIKAVSWLRLRETFPLSDRRKCLILEATRVAQTASNLPDPSSAA